MNKTNNILVLKPSNIKVLIVDDNEVDFILINEIFADIKNRMFVLDHCTNFKDGLVEIKKQLHDIYLIDYKLGMDDGVELIQEAINFGCEKPMIMLTGAGNPDIDNMAMNSGANDYLIKGDINSDILERSVRYAINSFNQRKIREESDRKFKNLFEYATDPIFLIDPKTRQFLEVNEIAAKRLGYTKKELLKLKIDDTSPIDNKVSIIKRKIEKLQNGEQIIFESLQMTKENKVFPVEVSARLIRHDGKEVIQSHVRDITERKATGDKLRASEKKYRNLVETSQDLIWRCDKQGRFTYLNPAWEQTHGYKIEEMLGRKLSEFQSPDIDGKDFNEFIQDTLDQNDGIIKGYEARHISKDGNVLHLVFNAIPLINEDLEVIGIQGTAFNFTDQIKAEKDLLESEKKYLELFKDTKDAICLTDNHRNIIDANHSFLQLFNYSREELHIIRFDDIFCTEKELKKFNDEIMNKNYATNMQIRFRSKENNAIIGLVSCTKQKNDQYKNSGFSFIIHDITESYYQNQLHQTRKLESIGAITSGIAHEFNNILMKVSGYTDMAINNLDSKLLVENYLNKIKKTTLNASIITKQMVLFSGEEQLDLTEHSINEIIKTMLESVKNNIPKIINIKYILDQSIDRSLVKLDSEKMIMIILNLVKNASESIGNKTGEIIISTGQEILDQDKFTNLYFYQNVQSGSYVYFAVTDTGVGMDKETLEHIFDPFFTTKFLGRGLGLAVVSGIVRAHRGAIRVFSTKDRGTSIKILLPNF